GRKRRQQLARVVLADPVAAAVVRLPADNEERQRRKERSDGEDPARRDLGERLPSPGSEQRQAEVRRNVVAVPDEEIASGAMEGHHDDVGCHDEERKPDLPAPAARGANRNHGQTRSDPGQLRQKAATVVLEDRDEVARVPDPGSSPETLAQDDSAEA